MLWPHVPDWWFALWAMLGIRNDFQQNEPWREVVRRNAMFTRDSLSYWRFRSLPLAAAGFAVFDIGGSAPDTPALDP